MTILSPAEKKALKARAHPLKPVVMVGDAGLTPGVLAEIERALASHELIKIRVASDDRDGREAMLAQICAGAGAAAVQHIGKILVVWRKREDAPVETKKKPAKRISRAKRADDAPRRKDRRLPAGDPAPGRNPRSQRAWTREPGLQPRPTLKRAPKQNGRRLRSAR